MIAAGFFRAHKPRAETDFPFILAVAALFLLALLPPTSLDGDGPLVAAVGLGDAADRMLRSLFFSCLYATHVYSAAPRFNELNELSVSVVRCSAASLWVLGVHYAGLILVPFQCVLVVYSRFARRDADSCYASVDCKSDGGSFEDAELAYPPQSSYSDPILPSDASELSECLDFTQQNGLAALIQGAPSLTGRKEWRPPRPAISAERLKEIADRV
jgi:hypothetical protein